MDPQIQYARTEDGVNIAYYALGSGPPLIWISPGVITNIEDEWDIPAQQQQLRATALGFTVVRYDLRGCGFSDRDVDDLSLQAMTRDLHAVVERVAPGTCAIMGPGSGALTAVAYAAAHPEQVSHLVLWAPVGAEKIESLDRLSELAGTDWRLACDSYASAVDDWSSPEDARRWAAMMRNGVSPETWLSFESERLAWDVDELAPRVQARTLVVHPRDHRYFSAELARRLAAAIPGARLALPEGATVFMPSRKGLETMAEFLSELSGYAPEKRTDQATKSPSKNDTHTILFTDMASSTSLAQQLGDAGAQDVRRTHNEIVRAALSANAGSEIKHTGDGIMASFSTASAALAAAIAIQRGVARHKAENPASPLGVYVGLNAGEPIAEDDDLFGTSINLASRICDHAQPGQILASNVVRELAAGKDFLFSDLGETELRGFEDPVKLWELKWQED